MKIKFRLRLSYDLFKKKCAKYFLLKMWGIGETQLRAHAAMTYMTE